MLVSRISWCGRNGFQIRAPWHVPPRTQRGPGIAIPGGFSPLFPGKKGPAGGRTSRRQEKRNGFLINLPKVDKDTMFRNARRITIGFNECAKTGIFLTTRLGVYEGFPYPWGFGVSEGSGLDFDMEEPVWVVEQLKKRFGVELINLTIGNPYVNPNVNRPYNGCEIEAPEIGVARIAKVTKAMQKAFPDITFVLSGTTFLMEKSLNYAAAMVRDYGVQLAGFGRMTFAYPEFWQDYLENGYIERKKCCIACGKCTKMMRSGGVAGCPVRDREVYTPLYKEYFKGEK